MAITDTLVRLYAWALARVEAEPVAARAVGLAAAAALARYGVRLDWNLVAAGIGLLGIPTVRSARKKVYRRATVEQIAAAAHKAGTHKKARQPLA